MKLRWTVSGPTLKRLGFLLLPVLLTTPVAGNGFYIPEWEALLENDLPGAIEEFQKGERDLRETRSHAWGLAANGLAMARWSVGDDIGAAEMWMDLCEWSFSEPTEDSPLRSADFLEGYLVCLRGVIEKVDVRDRVFPLLERLQSKGEEPDKKRLVAEVLFDMYRESGDLKGTQRMGEVLGLVTQWDAVVGPFGYAGSMDLEEVFGPERDPNDGRFQGRWGEVRWKKVPVEQPEGYLTLNELIHPNDGTAYARTALLASESAAGLITIESPNSLRVWWNGRLVLSRDRQDLDLETRTTIPVEIRSGINHIMIKSLGQGSSWGHRVFVYPADPANGARGAFTASDTYPQCHPDTRNFLAPRQGRAIERIANNSLRREGDEIGLLAGFYAAQLLRGDGRYEEAEDYLEELLQVKSEWSIPLVLRGMVAWELADERPASRKRLQNQARNMFESALSGSPYVIPAAVGLGEYFRTLKTFDSALDVLETAKTTAEKAQNESKAGVPTVPATLPTLDFTLGRVYEDLEYDVEARKAFARARESSSGEAEVWLRLSKLLGGARAGVQAFTVAEQGHQMFPLHRGLTAQLISAAQDAGREDETLPVLRKRLEMFPADLESSAKLAHLLEKLGHGEEALRVYDQMASINPDKPLPSIRSGNYLLRITDITSPAEANRISRALEYLRRGLEKKPQDIDLRRRIFAAEKALGDLSEKPLPPETKPLLDEYYDLDYFNVDQSRLGELSQEKANAVYLLDLMVQTLYPNGTSTSIIHQSVLLKNKEGRDEFSEISVPRDAEILVARTIIPDGTIYHAETVTDTGSDLSISMYGLEDGCVVDYAYRTSDTSIPAPGEGYAWLTYYFGGVTNPMLLSRLVVLVWDGVEMDWRANPWDFAPKIEKGTGYEAWTWEKQLSPGLKQESSLPPTSLIVPTVKITTCPDWSVGIKRAEAWLKGRREQEGKLAEVASLLALDVKTTEEKVAKVYDYIQKVIEPAGGGGTVMDTLKNRSGSVADKTFLAQALLDHMGVRGYIVVGYDPGAEQRFPPLPRSSYLGRPLLLVPGDQRTEESGLVHPKDTWVSFESRYLPLGELSSAHRTQTLFLFLPQSCIIHLPLDEDFSGGWVERQMAFDLKPLEESACRGRFFYHGDIRSSLRRAIMDQALREQVVSAEVARTIRGIDLDDGTFEGVEDLGDNVAIAFQGRVRQLLQPHDDGWTLDAIMNKSELSSAAPEPAREKAIKFDEPVKYNPYRASFRLSAASAPGDSPWVFGHIPKDTVLISRFGCFILDYELEGDTLWVSRAAYVPAQWIEPEDYPEFIEFCRSVDSAESERVTIGRYQWETASAEVKPE